MINDYSVPYAACVVLLKSIGTLNCPLLLRGCDNDKVFLVVNIHTHFIVDNLPVRIMKPTQTQVPVLVPFVRNDMQKIKLRVPETEVRSF